MSNIKRLELRCILQRENNLSGQLQIPSPIHELSCELFDLYNIRVLLKRDDQIHPEISGNKWRKLKLNIERFSKGKYDKILTFGGAYSNHIAATAATGKLFSIPTIGIIRGDELNINSNETLKTANENGMELFFVPRSTYSQRYERYYHEELRRKHGNVLIIEEGGANYYGMLGCAEINREIDFEPDYFISASGTGTTAAGLLYGSSKAKIISVPVLKNAGFIRDEIEKLIKFGGMSGTVLNDYMSRLLLDNEYHFGGYGKFNSELIDFINESYKLHNVPFDQIYTSKMFYTLKERIKSGQIEKGSSVIALHTGGLQGLSSIKEKLEFKF